MSGPVHAAFLLQKIGPYHHARLEAWAARASGEVVAVEYRAGESVYAWDTVASPGSYLRHQTNSEQELIKLLGELRPRVVVCVGYADPEISQAMAWAVGAGVPLVTCSDSTQADETRSWAKELLKRRVVSVFSAALVAGGRGSDYLASLGLEPSRHFRPWDVVDNAHFAAGAAASRHNEVDLRAILGLPARYFLCVARFVPKKNLRRLIEGYADYARRAGDDAWSLVLSGSGPLESELRGAAAAAGRAARVHFPGFTQYPGLPALYGLAGAFVLPSSSDQWGLVVNEAMAAGLPVLVSARCGCAPDLVREGENGFTFDPTDVDGLARRLAQLAEMEPGQRAAIGQRSREIVASYSPEAFAHGLEAAIACATRDQRAPRSWLTRGLVRLLSTRSVAPA